MQVTEETDHTRVRQKATTARLLRQLKEAGIGKRDFRKIGLKPHAVSPDALQVALQNASSRAFQLIDERKQAVLAVICSQAAYSRYERPRKLNR